MSCPLLNAQVSLYRLLQTLNLEPVLVTCTLVFSKLSYPSFLWGSSLLPPLSSSTEPLVLVSDGSPLPILTTEFAPTNLALFDFVEEVPMIWCIQESDDYQVSPIKMQHCAHVC